MSTLQYKENTRNQQNALYRALTRLFSGPITKRRRQFYRKERRIDMQKYNFKSATGAPFKKLTNDMFLNMSTRYLFEQRRAERYSDFDMMVYEPILGSALDIYADEITTSNEFQKLLTINCRNQEIKSILDQFYYNVLNIESNLYYWVRTMCKYGDFFLYLDIDDIKGIINVIGLPTREVERIEGQDKTNPNYVQFQWNTAGLTFENWQIAHFRILGDDKYAPYGISIYENSRRSFRQYDLLKQAMMSYRVVRCLHGDSKIWTPSGYTEIQDIKIGDEVFSYNEKQNKIVLAKVTDWIDNGPQEIWKISSLHRSIKTNENHPILVKDTKTDKIDYVLTKNIIPKRHQLVLPTYSEEAGEKVPINLKEEEFEWFGNLLQEGRQYYKEKKYKLSKRKKVKKLSQELDYTEGRIRGFLYGHKNKYVIKGLEYKKAKRICEELDIPKKFLQKYPKGMFNLERINLPKYVDKEFARFFGFMVGDGYMSKNLHQIGFATGIREDRNEYYKNILEKYCGKVSFDSDTRTSMSILGKYRVNNFYFAHVMKKMGFTSSVYTKTVPSWVYKTSNEIKKEFIRGLMDADGTIKKIKKAKAYELQLCNENIINGVKELCHQIGWNVSSKVYKKHTPGGRKINNFTIKETTSYSIYVSEIQTPRYENITKVEKTDEIANVFDIRVDNDLHNFVADGCVVHNSPERRVFYLDVGNIPPDDVEQYVLGFQKELKKNQIIDVETGRVDLRYNPMSTEEDYVIPVRGETNTRIETLAGGQYTGDVDDVKFLRDEMLAALKVPASYLLPDEGGGGEDRTTLAQKDIRFARTIQRIQRHVISELEKMGQIHLYTLGFRGDDIIDFQLKLANPSKIAALQELEHWRSKFDVASAATEGYFSKRWVAVNFFGLSEEEFIRNQREIYNDKKFEAMLEASMHMESGAKGMFGPEGGGPIGDMGEMGDLEGGGEPLDQELTLPPTEQETEGGENDTLLAQPEEPAKRDDGSRKIKVKKSLFGKDLTTTEKSKGKLYQPETSDKRKTSGARKQQMNNLSGLYPSRRSASPQKDLNRLGKGVFEEKGIYIKEETEIDTIQKDLNKITEELSK